MWKKILATPVLSHCIVAACVGLAVLLYLRLAPKSPGTYSSEPGPVTEAPEPTVVTKVVTKRVAVPGPTKIIYLDKEQTAAALKMPELKLSPDNVLAVATIPPSGDAPTTAIAKLTPEGEGKILYRVEPAPFFQLKKEFTGRARYLFAGTNKIEADLVIRPLRLGPVNLEAGAGLEIRRADDTVGARTWVGAEYRF